MRNRVVWSPVEVDFLKANREKISINQLTVALAKSRNAIKRKLDELDGKKVTKKMSKKSVIGKRPDLNSTFFRSNWEANTARYLNHKKIKWTYEPKVFYFDKIKHGTVSYCPDFQLKDGTWIEVKGYLTSQGKTAIRRMKKYYPDEFNKLQAIVGRPGTNADKFFQSIGVPIYAYYSDMSKQYKDKIDNWE